MSSVFLRLGIRPVLWLLAIGSVASCTLAWVGSSMFADARIAQMIHREHEQAQAEAKLASANLNQRLAQAQSIASTLALDPTVQAALGRFGPAAQASILRVTERGDMWRADPLLKPTAMRMAQMVDKFELSTLWATNAAGDTIMEGHATGVSPFTGTNYADRAYFKAAQQGINGRQYAIGRANNVYGLFFS